MVNLITTGATADDLRRLRHAFNVPVRVELDPWRSLVVSPVEDTHDLACAELLGQATGQLTSERYEVAQDMPWAVPGGTGYLMVPDLTVLPAGWRRDGDWGFDPAPLLVVEVASRSTRHADRARKLADYRLGGAGVYLLVDLPAMFEAHLFSTGKVVTAIGGIDLVVGGRPVRFTLAGGGAQA